MIKEVDKRLQMLNNENYDGQFLWTNKEEIKEDVIEFFDLDEEEDKEEIEGYLNYDNGEYVYSGMGLGLITLEEALENEFEQAKEAIEFYNQDEQEEILSWFYDEVETVSYKFEIDKEEHKNFIEFDKSKEYLTKTALEELKDEIQELQTKGYNTDFIEETITFSLTCEENITECHFIICKTDYKQIQEEFWKIAKAIGYIECADYCIAIGKDTLGAEDVITDSFYVTTEDEWKEKVKEILDLEDDDELDIYGKYTGEGEYVLEEWSELIIYRIDEKSLDDMKQEYNRRKLEGNIRE